MGPIDPNAAAPQLAGVGQSTPQKLSSKTGKGVSQINDQLAQSSSARVSLSRVGLAHSPILARLATARNSARLASATMKGVTGGNPMLKPSALVALSIALFTFMNARSSMALKEGMMSAEFTLLAQEQAESLAKTIMEIAEVEANDYRMKALIAGVQAGISLGTAGAMAKGGTGTHRAFDALNQGLQALTRVAENLISANTALAKGSLEAIKTIKEFSMQTTQKAGQNAADAAKSQQEEFNQLMQLLDKLSDALTRWHGQRG